MKSRFRQSPVKGDVREGIRLEVQQHEEHSHVAWAALEDRDTGRGHHTGRHQCGRMRVLQRHPHPKGRRYADAEGVRHTIRIWGQTPHGSEVAKGLDRQLEFPLPESHYE